MSRRIALVGNPNVGKSTIFNALTGMRQHTGNWPGVTVSCTYGTFHVEDMEFSVVDLPGIYSFDTRSEEEEVTKHFVESEEYDFLLLVCDATCLERGLHLLKQAADTCPSTWCIGSNIHPIAHNDRKRDSDRTIPQFVLCVNLCDEASRKGIVIDFPVLEEALEIPVIPCRAKERNGLDALKQYLFSASQQADEPEVTVCGYRHVPSLFSPTPLSGRVVEYPNTNYRAREERMDRLLTGPLTGSLCMLLLLFGIFWLTISGANVPSSILWNFFFSLETFLADAAVHIGAPEWFISAFIYGVYRVVAWIISVMLPPMAIFFPLFTLLEDFGYLPRIAYNMDGAFQKCSSCGKQCLTMAMGLGCNAAGVTGCRIIDSPRERLIAILTNSLVPCNGRFPLLITMISLSMMGLSAFSSGSMGTTGNALEEISPSLFAALPPWALSLLSALLLTGFILLGVAATLCSSWLLSRTLLKGVPSSFTLELPPYRRPQFRKVLIRSIFDRTLFVLGRAVMVAAPAGLLIWIMANTSVRGSDSQTLLSLFSGILDPLGRLMGLDGVILMAFILGFPANEIVLPIILMAYLQSGHLVDMEETSALFSLLSANGWTLRTYICMAIFSLFHWPCSTTCLTVRKETGSWRWTFVAVIIPTLFGVLLCILVSALFRII